MNNKILIGIVVFLLIVIGFLMYSSKLSAPKFTDNTQATSTITTVTTTGIKKTSTIKSTPTSQPITQTSTTFKSIFNQQGSHTCSYEQITSSMRTNVIIYIADGKMRAEFRTSGSNPVSNLMVYNGGILYVWKEGMGTGTKNPLNSVSELPFIVPKDLTSGVVLGTSANNVSWDCHDWSKDNSLLVPPSTVKFY